MEQLRNGTITSEQSSLRPLPPYVGWYAVAKKLEKSVMDLQHAPEYWFMTAQIMLEAEHIYNEYQAQKRG